MAKPHRHKRFRARGGARRKAQRFFGKFKRYRMKNTSLGTKFHYKLTGILPIYNSTVQAHVRGVSFYRDYPTWYQTAETGSAPQIQTIPGNNLCAVAPLLFRIFDQYKVTGLKVEWLPNANVNTLTGLYQINVPAITGVANFLYMAIDPDDADVSTVAIGGNVSTLLNDPSFKLTNTFKKQKRFMKGQFKNWWNCSFANPQTYPGFSAGLIQGPIPTRGSVKTIMNMPGSPIASIMDMGFYRVTWYTTFRSVNTSMSLNAERGEELLDADLLPYATGQLNKLELLAPTGGDNQNYRVFTENGIASTGLLGLGYDQSGATGTAIVDPAIGGSSFSQRGELLIPT